MEIFNCFGRNALHEFNVWVLPRKNVKALVEDTAFDNTKIKWLERYMRHLLFLVKVDNYLGLFGRVGYMLLPLRLVYLVY